MTTTTTAAFTRIAGTERRSTFSTFNCPDCKQTVKNFPIVMQATDADGRTMFVCTVCPKPAPRLALRSAAPAAPVAAGPMRAKFASRCPGCGSPIEAGAPLFRDAALGKYVSDCCI